MRQATQTLLNRADAATKARHFAKASRFLSEAMENEPENVELRIRFAMNCFALEDFASAADAFHRLHVDHPDDQRAWQGAAVSYMKLGRYDVAEQFLKKIVSHNPQDYDAWLNLCHNAGASGQHTNTLFYAMQALELRPLDPRSHNNLGCSLLAVQQYKDALSAFETSLTLDASNLDALSNIATIYSLTGNTREAIDTYERCLQLAGKNTEFADTTRYRMSFDLLRLGRLKEGWAHYDYGFKPLDSRSRGPKRSFPVPQWDGRALEHETLLIWREQGLGDELMFFAAIKDAERRVKKLIIECDRRMVPVLQRSFPDALVRAEQIRNAPGFPPMVEDMDFHIPAGSLMSLYRNELDDYRRTEAYIRPDPERVAEFRRRLAALPGRRKVGISWRSGVLNAERNSAYASLSDWEPVLRLQGVDIINLQYGDCSEELRNVSEHFGITIHQWDDLDLKNDLDGVFALAHCLDHVVSVTTAPSVMAAAVGTPTSVLMPRSSWTLFGTDEYLIFPRLTPYICEYGQPLRERIPAMAAGVQAALAALD